MIRGRLISIALAVACMAPHGREERRVGHSPGPVRVSRAGVDARPAGPIWKISTRTPSLNHLSPQLTINGETQTPSARLRGSDALAATWPVWVYGDLLTLSTGAADPDLAEPTPIGAEVAVDFVGGDYYEDSLTVAGDIAATDFVIELVTRTDIPGADDILAAKRNGTSEGWEVVVTSAGNVQLVIEDASANTVTSVCATAADERSWSHYFIVGDTSGSMRCHRNGVTSDTDSIAAVGTMTNASALTLGARSGGATPTISALLYVSVWTFTDVGTHVQDQLAYERFAAASGLRTEASTGQVHPITQTRATPAKVLSGTALHIVGDNWMRVEASGLLIQSVSTNIAIQSETFDTSWTLNAVTLGVDGVAAPDGQTTGDGVIGTAADTGHSLEQSITMVADENTYSVYAQPGNESFVRLENVTDAVSADFNLSTCAVGTTAGSPSNTFAETVGSWCRVGFAVTTGAGADVYRISACEADNDCVYTGDAATEDVWLWGAQVEQVELWTSYVTTTTTSVTRSADLLNFKADDGNVSATQGTFGCTATMLNYDMGDVGSLIEARVSGAAERYYISTNVAGDTMDVKTASSAGSAGRSVGVGDIVDGVEHRFYSTYVLDDMQGFADQVAGAMDTDVAMPGTVTDISLGQNGADSSFLNGWLRDCYWYSQRRTP